MLASQAAPHLTLHLASCASWTMVAIMTDTSKPGILAAQMLQNSLQSAVHMGLVPIPPNSRKPAQLF